MKIPIRYFGLVFICVFVVVAVFEFKGTIILMSNTRSKQWPLKPLSTDGNLKTHNGIDIDTFTNYTRREDVKLAAEFRSPRPKDFMLDIQEKRQQRIRETCAEMKTDAPGNTFYHQPTIQNSNWLMYNDVYSFVFCPLPRIGAKSWKNVIMNLTDDTRIVQPKQHLTILNELSLKEKNKRLKTHTKFLFVRNPFERILSVYRSKFENPDSKVFLKFHGAKIIARYRANPSIESLRTGRTPSFREFIRYLIDPLNQKSFNRYWDFMHKVCAVCEYSYDFIGHFENLQAESNYILHNIAGDKFSFPTHIVNATNSSDINIYHKYFSRIPMEDIVRLYQVYKMDFQLFDYSFPYDLIDGIEKS
ncbi:carbohydrate sulfotransferase 11-like [Glandiceps talaboti]